MARPEEVSGQLLGEGVTEAGRTRAGWVTAVLRKAYGVDAPSAPFIELEERAPWPELRMSGRHRRVVESTARAVVQGLLSHGLDAVRPRLAEEVWMLWGDGTLGCHLSYPLMETLSGRKADSVWAIPAQIRTYAWAELRAQLPRPVGAALDAALRLSGTMVCAMRIDTPRNPVGRVMVALAPMQGVWRALTLPLPSVDTAVAASKPAFHEEDWLRFADKIARQSLLHNDNQLRSLRNQMMDRIFTAAGPITAEVMIQQLAQSDPPADRLELAFLGTHEERYENIDAVSGLTLRRELDRRAQEIWKRPLETLRPKLAITDLGIIDAKTQVPKPSGRAVTLMLRCLERDQRNEELERWRVGGIWS